MGLANARSDPTRLRDGFDVDSVRAQYSVFEEGFAFLDAPGGTQVPDRVGERIAAALRTCSGNLGAPYCTSRRIGALVTDARDAAGRLLGCDADEVAFGANMTSLNFALTRSAASTLRPGDEVVVTTLDHDANVAPWLAVARDHDVSVRVVDVRDDLSLDLDDLRSKLSERTRVVAFPWASNAVGTLVDARAVCALAHEVGALAWVDAVHYAAHAPIDVAAVGADVLLCSAYKFCGPHVGVAYVRRELAESWQPYNVRPTPDEPVGARFQTGTQAYELLAGFVECVAYLDEIGGLGTCLAHERALTHRFLTGLPDGVEVYGSPGVEGRVATFLLNVAGRDAADVAANLAERGVGVWHHRSWYAIELTGRLPYPGEAVRAGFVHYTTEGEVDRFLDGLRALAD